MGDFIPTGKSTCASSPIRPPPQNHRPSGSSAITLVVNALLAPVILRTTRQLRSCFVLGISAPPKMVAWTSREDIGAPGHVESFSSRSPRPRKDVDQYGVRTARRPNVAGNASPQEHRTEDKTQSSTVPQSVHSFSSQYSVTKPGARLFRSGHRLETYKERAGGEPIRHALGWRSSGRANWGATR